MGQHQDGTAELDKLMNSLASGDTLIVTKLDQFARSASQASDIIVERTQEGKEIARQHKGYKEGRPKKYSKEKIGHVMKLLQTHSCTEVERITGISKSTLIRENRRK